MYAPLNSGHIVELEPETPDFYYEATVSNEMVTNPETYNGTKVKVVGVLRAKPSTNFGTLSRGVYFTKAFGEKYRLDSATSEITQTFKNHIKNKRYSVSTFNAYVQFKYDDYSKDDGSEGFTPEEKDGYAIALNGDQTSAITSIFASFLSSGKDNLKTDKLHLRSLAGIKVADIVDENNTAIIKDHEFKDVPQSISIYPKNFETKNGVTAYLNKWNKNVTLTINGEPVGRELRNC